MWFWGGFDISLLFHVLLLIYYIKNGSLFEFILILSFYILVTYWYQLSTNSDLFLDQKKWHELSEVLNYPFFQKLFTYNIDEE